MKFDKNTVIAGFSIKEVRDFFKKVGYSEVGFEYATHLLKADEDTVKTLLDELINIGYMTKEPAYNEHTLPYYQITINGQGLAKTLFLARIPLKKADEIYKLFLERVKEVNENDYYLVGVEQVILFGSYLKREEDIGDIDIATKLKIKDLPDMPQKLDERRKQLKKGNSNFLNYLNAPTYEVELFLKSKNRYLDFTGVDDGVFDIIPDDEQKIVYPTSK